MSRKMIPGPAAAAALAVLLLLLLLLHVGEAAAQAPDSLRPTVIRVGEISVQAARPVTTVGGASAIEVKLDSLGLAPAPTLDQVLREVPLVQVRTNSRGETQFSLRGSGSDARQVAVLVDGVPLSLTWDDRTDLSVLPATAIGGLTLVRGLSSMLHGPNVLGGVVEVGVGHHAGQWLPGPAMELAGGVESTGAVSASVLTARRFAVPAGRLGVRAGAGYRERPGVALPGGVEQPQPTAAQPFRTFDPQLRTNTDLRHRDGFMALRYLSEGGVWSSLTAASFSAERGIAAELHAQSPRFWRYPHVSRTVGVLGAGTGDRRTPFGGHGDLEASFGYDVGRTEIVSYRSGAYRDAVGSEEGDDRTLTVRLMGDHTLFGRGELRAAATFAEITHDERLDGADPLRYRQRLWSVGGESAWRLDGPSSFPAVRVSVSGAVDGADTPHSGDKPAMGTLRNWGARAGATAASGDGRLLLHAGASRRARFPALRELYSGALGRFAPNPGLRPEVLAVYEAGLTAALGAGELQLVGFHRDLHDAIEQVTLADRRRQRVNVGAVRSTGVEVLGSTRVRAVGVGGFAAVQTVKVLDDAGAVVPGHPQYQPELSAGLDARITLPYDVGAGAGMRYVGRQYCVDPDVAGADLELAASRRFDVDVARTFRLRRGGFGSAMEVRGSIDNVTDAAIYDQCGLPQGGRTLRLQLRVR